MRIGSHDRWARFTSHNRVARLLPLRLLMIPFLLLFVTEVGAQVNLPANQAGTPINTSSIQHGVDSVNTMGLGLHIDIPLFSLQERGRTYTWRYVYNSPVYNLTF